MSPGHWTTVFDVRDQGGIFDYWFALPAMVIGAVGTLVALKPKASESIFPGGFFGEQRRGFGLFVLLFSVAWLAMTVTGTYHTHRRLLRALSDDSAAVVGGVVTNFHPMEGGCHGPESFDVADQSFRYQDCVITGGFNSSSTYGGPIRSGQHVRIVHHAGTILRLQIAE